MRRPVSSKAVVAALVAVLVGLVPAWPAATETDAEIEEFLRTAEIVEVKKLGVGVTNPLKLTLRLGEVERNAVFKAVDTFGDSVSIAEINTSDRYAHDIAAYRLDRLIGLNMVPVTIERSVEGKTGSVQQWIPETFDEGDRIEEGMQPPDLEEFERLVNRMRIFDTLIYNTDRNKGNILYERDGWLVHLIDHSRAFRLNTGRPPQLEQAMIRRDSQLEKGLVALEKDELKQAVGRLLHQAQINAVMKRRKQLLKAWETARLAK